MLHDATSRLIKLIMAFAIFWMVIGDLITYHQERIFGADYYGHHTPFTKPGSKDDGKTGQWKSSKDVDKQFFVFIVVHSGFGINMLHHDAIYILHPQNPILIVRQLLPDDILSRRGPPVC